MVAQAPTGVYFVHPQAESEGSWPTFVMGVVLLVFQSGSLADI